MTIGLIDEDKTKYPNFALMKIAGFHKAKGDTVEFATMFNKYDVIYKSKVFTFSQEDTTAYKTELFFSGGTGYNNFDCLRQEIEDSQPDFSLYKCKHAYGFTTRGCIRKCDFCIVPQKEGPIRPVAKVRDIMQDKKTLILMDNNILAHEHGIKQIEYIRDNKIPVDFNQGLDCRLIDNTICKILKDVKFFKPLRISCDSINILKTVFETVKKLRWYNITPSRFFCYVMVKNLNEGIEIVKYLKTLHLEIFVQPFRDYKNNEPIDELKHFARFVNRREIFNSTTWENYRYKK